MKTLWSLLIIVQLLLGCHNANNKESLQGSLPKSFQKEIKHIQTENWDSLSLKQNILYADSIGLHNPDSAKILLKSAVLTSRNIHYTTGIVDALRVLGKKYAETDAFDSALYFIRLALPYAQKLPSDLCVIEALYIQIAGIYYEKAQFDTALYFVHKGMANLTKHVIKGEKGHINAFNTYRLANVLWNNMGNWINADPYLDKAEQLALQLQDSNIMLTKLMDVKLLKGNTFQARNQIDSAVTFYQIVAQNKSTSLETKMDANFNLGTIYSLRFPSKAILYFTKGLKLCQERYGLNTSMEIRYLLGLGTSYINKDYNQPNRNDIKQAESIFRNIQNRISQTRLGINLPNFYSNYAITQGNQHKYEKAYELSMNAIKIRDSLYQKDKLEMMGKLDVQYRIAEKDKQLIAQQLKLSQTNTWMVGIAGGALVLIGLMLGLLRRKKHKEEMKQMKAMLAGEEKERIRMARELHDGVLSTLSAVKINFTTLHLLHPDEYTQEHFQQAIGQLEQSIQELRSTSHNLFPQVLQQEGLANGIRIFCERISKIAPVNLNFQLAGTLPVLTKEFELSIYRMVQELIQNIIKHSGATHALIQMTAREDWLGITIDDNGIGMPENPSGHDHGMGLEQIKQQVKAMKGSLEIEQGDGTSIYLGFDLNTN